MKFKGNCKNFDEKWNNDVIGLMALYEASQFSTEGETILDEAANFSYHLLHDMIDDLHNDALIGMVRHALNSPFQKTIPLLDIKNSAKYYNGTVLQELAKLDFSKLQSIHHTELHQVSRYIISYYTKQHKILDFSVSCQFNHMYLEMAKNIPL